MKTFNQFTLESFSPIVYHGTKHKFDKFTKQQGNISTVFGNDKVERYGHFFSEDEHFAKGFAGKKGHVIKARIATKKPFDMRHGVTETHEADLNKHGVSSSWLSNHLQPWERFDGEDGHHFVHSLKKAGYTSAIFHEYDPDTGKKSVTHVAFDPKQIHQVK